MAYRVEGEPEPFFTRISGNRRLVDYPEDKAAVGAHLARMVAAGHISPKLARKPWTRNADGQVVRQEPLKVEVLQVARHPNVSAAPRTAREFFTGSADMPQGEKPTGGTFAPASQGATQADSVDVARAAVTGLEAGPTMSGTAAAAASTGPTTAGRGK